MIQGIEVVVLNDQEVWFVEGDNHRWIGLDRYLKLKEKSRLVAVMKKHGFHLKDTESFFQSVDKLIEKAKATMEAI